MNDERSFERAARAWLEHGANRAPDRAIQSVLLAIESTPQERDLRIPWRLPRMNKLVATGLGTAAVIVALFVGTQLLGPPAPSGVGGAPSATTSPSPSPSPSPSLSPISVPPLTQSFTSTIHGIALSYPEGWTARAATEPWTDRTFPLNFLEPHADFLYDPSLTDRLFLTIASKPIGGSTAEDWVAEQMASGEGCTATEPIAVDGATGLIGTDGCNVAAVTTAGRGYWIQLYASGDETSAYDPAWFEGVLATVQLQPANAVDVAPSASP